MPWYIVIHVAMARLIIIVAEMDIIIVRMWPWLAVISLHILSTLAKDKDLHCGGKLL